MTEEHEREDRRMEKGSPEPGRDYVHGTKRNHPEKKTRQCDTTKPFATPSDNICNHG